MSSNHHEDEVFKAKRRPKNPIKFNISLNDEQKAAKEIILLIPSPFYVVWLEVVRLWWQFKLRLTSYSPGTGRKDYHHATNSG
jgi:hypothetical protein